MQRPATWLVVLVITASGAAADLCPRLPAAALPSLTTSDLPGVTIPKGASVLLRPPNPRCRTTPAVFCCKPSAVSSSSQVWLHPGGRSRSAAKGQIMERFTRAIDQLGSDKLDMRLAASTSWNESLTVQRSIGRRSRRPSSRSCAGILQGLLGRQTTQNRIRRRWLTRICPGYATAFPTFRLS